MSHLPFKKLLIWQKAMELSKKIYTVSHTFPKEELFGLTSQIKRAALSVPSNIAEGSQRGTDKDFANFLTIAKGSLAELETQCLFAVKMEYASLAQFEHILKEIDDLGKMIYSFRMQLLSKK